jgi:hypothetical protein
MKKFINKSLLAVTTVLLSSSAVASNSPWLLNEEEFNTSFIVSNETYKKHWAGTRHALLADYVSIKSYILAVEYGLTDDIALDIAGGYIRSNYPAASIQKIKSGRADTTFGARWKFVNEDHYDNYMPTLAVRLGGTIRGSYPLSEAGNPHSPGDKVNGYEFSLLAGKYFDMGLSLSAELGHRHKGNPVPNETFYSLSASYYLPQNIVANLSYVRNASNSGSDIGNAATGFTPTNQGFQGTKEKRSLINAGAGYIFDNGVYAGLNYAHALRGRNTGESKILSLILSYKFFI